MRYNIDYGIDLGTTNSAIARMVNGIPTILKSDSLKDTIPSCVYFTKKGVVFVGDNAYNALKKELASALRNPKENSSNVFTSFKRTMGSDYKYYSPNTGKYYSSEELSAEVLKKLKSFVQDENINAVVITHPVTFIGPKIEATKKAGEMAGFEYIELIQEPVAASIAYGIQKDAVEGYWLVYDLGGGTFDVSLVKNSENMPVVVDNHGCDPLGGKDIDFAIVDSILVPYLREKYSINSILRDPLKKEKLRRALWPYAEEAKIQLSSQQKWHIITNIGDLEFEDDEGREPEIDLIISRDDVEKVIAPIFQKTIDITKELLSRNGLVPEDVSALLLVGGPTHTPILRKMLKEQITEKIPTTIDPMTVVAKGAALYGSTRRVPEKIRSKRISNDLVQLEINFRSTTTEELEYVSCKVLNPNNNYEIEIIRADGAYTTGRVSVGNKPQIFELLILPNRPNNFKIVVFDNKGNQVNCEPSEFNILHGISGVDKMQVLPYHIGITVFSVLDRKEVFLPIKGLEKGRIIGTGISGIVENLITPFDIRPGNPKDVLRIPIYQGEYNSEGTDPDLNFKIIDVIISGDQLPKFLPANSPVNITIKVDSSHILTFEAEFPTIDHTEEVRVEIKKIEIPTSESLSKRLQKIEKSADEVDDLSLKKWVEQTKEEIIRIGEDVDSKIRIENEIKDKLRRLEEEKISKEPEKVLKEIKGILDIGKTVIAIINDGGDRVVRDSLKGKNIEKKLEEEIEKLENKAAAYSAKGDLKGLKALRIEATNFVRDAWSVLKPTVSLGLIFKSFEQNFTKIPWRDPYKARELIKMGSQILKNSDFEDGNQLAPIVEELIKLSGEKGPDLLLRLPTQ
ncbi:MAG: Hsp70 family protein [Candidatus Hydrogenedentes bacterium]|nr:Hsp70 family protein [Candidatus Hydrogenedentota bacterium]